MNGAEHTSGEDDDSLSVTITHLFQEPDNFRPPEKQATTATHRLALSHQELTVRLVGTNPLWVSQEATWYGQGFGPPGGGTAKGAKLKADPQYAFYTTTFGLAV